MSLVIWLTDSDIERLHVTSFESSGISATSAFTVSLFGHDLDLCERHGSSSRRSKFIHLNTYLPSTNFIILVFSGMAFCE